MQTAVLTSSEICKLPISLFINQMIGLIRYQSDQNQMIFIWIFCNKQICIVIFWTVTIPDGIIFILKHFVVKFQRVCIQGISENPILAKPLVWSHTSKVKNTFDSPCIL